VIAETDQSLPIERIAPGEVFGCIVVGECGARPEAEPGRMIVGSPGRAVILRIAAGIGNSPMRSDIVGFS
jgi:hypothetical protein